MKSAKLDVAILLNLATDHLDRYDKLEDYFDAKWALLERADAAIFPNDLKPGRKIKPIVDVKFSNKAELFEILKQTAIFLSKRWNFKWSDEFLKNLPTLPHRLERWKSSDGRIVFNDSKATTVHATQYALQVLGKEFPSIWVILGGKYKGDDFSALKSLIRAKDRVLICGEARAEIQKQLKGLTPAPQSFETLASLLEKISPELESGVPLLLSPACSSYDEFDNFEERGKFFTSKLQERWNLSKPS